MALLGGEWKARIENVTGWWDALTFALCVLALAALWLRVGLRVDLRSH